MITNLDATNFRLMKTPVSKPGKENWKEVIAHREDVFLEGLEIFKDYLVLSSREQEILVQLGSTIVPRGGAFEVGLADVAEKVVVRHRLAVLRSASLLLIP